MVTRKCPILKYGLPPIFRLQHLSSSFTLLIFHLLQVNKQICPSDFLSDIPAPSVSRRPLPHFIPHTWSLYFSNTSNTLLLTKIQVVSVNTFIFFHFLTYIYHLIYILNCIFGDCFPYKESCFIQTGNRRLTSFYCVFPTQRTHMA